MKRILLVLPDLGGLGKSTISEMLITLFELNDEKVIGFDGDPVAKGLYARRGGRLDNILVLSWPMDARSKATAIIDNVEDDGIGVLDFGANTLGNLAVDATVFDLLTNKDPDVSVTGLLVGEASKPGNAGAILTMRKAYPDADFVFVKNAKSGTDWSMYETACAGLPAFQVQAIPTAITNWLSTYESNRFGGKQRLSLTDIISNPAPGYGIVRNFLAARIASLGGQDFILERFGNLNAFEPGDDDWGPLVPAKGDMSDAQLRHHIAESRAVERFLAAETPPLQGDAGAMKDFIAKFGSVGLEYVQARDVRRAWRPA